MKDTEAIKIMALITTAYPNRPWTDEQTELWIEMLAPVPFERAKANIRNHIMTNQFPPTIAEVARVEYEERIDPEIYQRNKQIAHQQWVAAGGEPEAFVYDPTGSNNARLTS
ncbi:MAG: replicative helicase loader/inhibitor [Candidatus Cohnella colombiensis]|uniref:Replicative helicase loader/inhibitor n=1 Tax=Candidatus Cohnella colombiensis TaxID=3121368 RepID=A0AA95JBV6_9BACL|nr:MAG: replicative helicase loader/inhibitor [Cohnella sp.]